jgi:hypothetical protein
MQEEEDHFAPDLKVGLGNEVKLHELDGIARNKKMKNFKSYQKEIQLDEVLDKSDDMGKWIKDFKKSDAPQFAGKSVEKRRKMAIAAKLQADREEVVKEAKNEREYGYEGEMAMTQLKTLMRHAEHMMSMMEEDTDLPEWVQSKITLATDYVQTAHDYLMSEMNEEVDENYVSHAQRKAVWASRNDEKKKAKKEEKQVTEFSKWVK